LAKPESGAAAIEGGDDREKSALVPRTNVILKQGEAALNAGTCCPSREQLVDHGTHHVRGLRQSVVESGETKDKIFFIIK